MGAAVAQQVSPCAPGLMPATRATCEADGHSWDSECDFDCRNDTSGETNTLELPGESTGISHYGNCMDAGYTWVYDNCTFTCSSYGVNSQGDYEVFFYETPMVPADSLVADPSSMTYEPLSLCCNMTGCVATSAPEPAPGVGGHTASGSLPIFILVPIVSWCVPALQSPVPTRPVCISLPLYPPVLLAARCVSLSFCGWWQCIAGRRWLSERAKSTKRRLRKRDMSLQSHTRSPRYHVDRRLSLPTHFHTEAPLEGPARRRRRRDRWASD